jgi:cobalt-zinc-cadmium efflux system outer membrane protein
MKPAMKFIAPIIVSALLCLPAHDAHAEPATARDVELRELLSHAERHAPRLELARSERGRAEAARAEASAWLHEDPTLTVAAGPRFAGEHASALDIQASLGQPIEIAGERGLRRTLATRVEEHAVAELASARAALGLDVRLTYQAGRVARARLDLATQVVGFTERTLQVARRRLAAGDATRIDVLVAESGSARARAALLETERALAEARTELAVLTGWPLREPPQVPSGLEPPETPPNLSEALAKALAAHPELRAQHAAVAEARARLALADRQALPAPTFGVSFSREGSVGSPANTILLGSIALPIPLWTGNREARARDRAEAEISSREEALAARGLEAAVIRAHGALTSAAARAVLLDGAASAALDASLTLLERGFEHGELSALEVAAAEEQLAAVQLDALDARADYHRARAELDYLGGGEPGGNAPTVLNPTPGSNGGSR